MFTSLRNIASFLLVISLLSACDGVGGKYNAETPKDNKDQRRADRGKLTGDDGFTLFGGKKGSGSGGESPIGVNSFLWRASLDTLAFMPLASADPFGGVIITDWYEDPSAKGERFKVNALILDKTLRSDGVKVSLFKQKLDSKGQWQDVAVDGKLARDLEDTILTRARQLRVSQEE